MTPHGSLFTTACHVKIGVYEGRPENKQLKQYVLQTTLHVYLCHEQGFFNIFKLQLKTFGNPVFIIFIYDYFRSVKLARLILQAARLLGCHLHQHYYVIDFITN